MGYTRSGLIPQGFPAMADATLRQITMLQLLPRRPPGRTTTALASALEERGFRANLRTIQRDLNRLSAAYPLTTDDSNPPGWYWARGSESVSLPGQDPFSALTWQLIEQHLKPALPIALQREAEPQFREARQLLSSMADRKFRRWTKRVRIHPRSMTLHSPEVRQEILEAVYRGLFDSRQIRIRYKRRGDSKSREMNIHPLALVIRDGLMYVLVTVDDFTDVRQTVLHRYQRAELLPDPAREPADFDLDTYIEQGGFDYAHGRSIRLVARFDPDAGFHLLETPLAKNQTVRNLPDRRLEVTARVADSEQLRWWLLGFGCYVEVVKPAALRRFMRGHATSMAESYAS